MTDPKMRVSIIGSLTVSPLFDLMRFDPTYIAVGQKVDPKLIEDSTIIVFTGGTDLDPALYGQKNVLKKPVADKARDEAEKQVFFDAASKGVPMLGICRGAQFLNVMNGGSIIQHVDNHTSRHNLVSIYPEFKKVNVSSTHHQMMVAGKEAKWKAWSIGIADEYRWDKSVKDVKFKLDGFKKVKEPECLFYPRTQSLCIQWHPEYDMDKSESRQLFYRLLNDCLGV